MRKTLTRPQRLLSVFWLLGALLPHAAIAGSFYSSPIPFDGSARALNLAAAPGGDMPGRELGLATHSVGTIYYTQGTAVAKVVTERGQLNVLAKPMVGPNAWMPTFSRGEIELGIISAPDASWAFHGVKDAGFPLPAKKIRLLQRGVPLWIGMIVRQDSPVKSLAGLKGKRVASGYGGNFIITKIIEAILATVGLSPRDIVPVPVASFIGGQEAFREGRVDAIFAGTPATAATVETAAAVGARYLPMSRTPQVVEKCLAIIPGCEFNLLKAGYGILKEDTLLMGYYNYIVGHADALSQAAAYQLVKALWGNYKELWPIHVTLRAWRPETMVDPNSGIPYHPGAVRFYKETGVWTAELEKRHERMLREGGE